MALGGLVKRRTVWLPTWRGWLAATAVCLLVLVVTIQRVHPFLAIDAPVGGEVLVVEGWLSRRGLVRAVATFRLGGYDRIVTTGLPIPEGTYLADFYPEYRTFAGLSASVLRRAGIDSARVIPVPAPDVRKDRTYASAVAVRRWLEADVRPVRGLDVLSSGPHARRSRLLYRTALGDRVAVGVIGQPPTGYDPDRWWTSSAGVRTVLREAIAYGYAKFLFYP